MKLEKCKLSDIHYERCEYPIVLKESLLRIGLNFAVQLEACDEGYQCVDGNKRLSAIADILKEQPDHPKFQQITVILRNHARTAAPDQLRNHH